MKLLRSALLLTLLLVTVAAGSCFFLPADPGTIVTLENRTSVSVKVTIRAVSLDYLGPPEPEPYLTNRNRVLAARAVDRIGTGIPPSRKIGITLKYLVAVTTETDPVLWWRVFTWDELNEMNWTIVIEAQGVGNAPASEDTSPPPR